MKVPCRIMAPAGSPEAFQAALAAGAEEIYMGVAGYGARQFAANFSVNQFCQALQQAHLYGTKINLTFNTLMTDDERESSGKWLKQLYQAGLDAVIVQDWGVARYLFDQFPGLSVHASTQFSLATPSECIFMAQQGFSRLVLARELSIEEIKAIRTALNNAGFQAVELEVFASGALCLACSGKCYLSSFLGGRSGNRGSCAQPCRLPYRKIDLQSPSDSRKNSLSEVKPRFYLSLKDQWQESDDVDKLAAAGVDVIKLEGRMKSPAYVYQAVEYYRMLLDGKRPYNNIDKTFNRGYDKGYLYQHDPAILNLDFSANWGVPLGKVKDGYIRLDHAVRNGDGIVYLDAQLQKLDGGNVSRIREFPVGNIAAESTAGTLVEFDIPVPAEAKFVWRTYDFRLQKAVQKAIEQKKRYVPIEAEITAVVGNPVQLKLSDGSNSVTVKSEVNLEPSVRHPASEESLKTDLDKFGKSPFILNKCIVNTDGNSFVPVSVLNKLRQQAVDQLSSVRIQSQYRKAVNLSNWTAPVCGLKTTSGIRFAACVENEQQAQRCREKGVIVYQSQAPVTFPADTVVQTENCLAGSLDQAIQFQQAEIPFALDWSANVTNVRCLKQIEQMFPFMKICYISPEILTGAVLSGGTADSYSVIESLVKSATAELGVVIWGNPRLMFTRKTLFEQPSCDLLTPDEKRLRIRKNTNAQSGSSVYEVRQIDYLNVIDKLKQTGLTEFRFDFVWLQPEEISEILSLLG